PHHEPEVHGSDVDQVALASVLSSPQTQPPMAACFAGMREGAFDLLSPLAQELLAFGPTDASAIVVEGLARKHPALIREAALALLVGHRDVRAVLRTRELKEQFHLVVALVGDHLDGRARLLAGCGRRRSVITIVVVVRARPVRLARSLHVLA